MNIRIYYKTLKHRTGCKHTEQFGLYHIGKNRKQNNPPKSPTQTPDRGTSAASFSPFWPIYKKKRGVKVETNAAPQHASSPSSSPSPGMGKRETKGVPREPSRAPSPVPGGQRSLRLCYREGAAVKSVMGVQVLKKKKKSLKKNFKNTITTSHVS